ncbi:MAG: hypothetical protein JO122_02030 [Acetobacteraceae bacterium]|nr:hypothetical protein [Acetobacteraceae bacterium]
MHSPHPCLRGRGWLGNPRGAAVKKNESAIDAVVKEYADASEPCMVARRGGCISGGGWSSARYAPETGRRGSRRVAGAAEGVADT